MKNLKMLFLAAATLICVSACAGSMESLSKEDIQRTVAEAKREPSYLKLEKAQQMVALALEYNDQGGYDKSAELFLQAADVYRELNLKSEERRALIAAAKMQLKCSQRQPFLLTMTRFKGTLSSLEMPSEDERLLLNLSDNLNKQPLTFPLKGSWNVIFCN